MGFPVIKTIFLDPLLPLLEKVPLTPAKVSTHVRLCMGEGISGKDFLNKDELPVRHFFLFSFFLQFRNTPSEDTLLIY